MTDQRTTQQSTGHLEFIGEYEYFEAPSGDLYRAKLTGCFGTDGYRLDGRCEAPKHMAAETLALHRSIVGQPELTGLNS